MSKEVFSEIVLFNLIELHRRPVSFVSGVFLRDHLNSMLRPCCFAHVLPKGQNKFPYFKHYAKNVVLLTPEEHHMWDHGTEEERIQYAMSIEERTRGKGTADWQKLKDLRDELKKEYDKHFPSRRGLIVGYKYDAHEVFNIVSRLNKEHWQSLKTKL